MTSEMFVDSLRNRIRAMNELWQRAVSDLTPEQFNHHEREGVLPIAFSFTHFMRAQDQSISVIFRGEPTLWASGGWAGKVGVGVDALGREESVSEMELQRVEDLAAWREFQTQVIRRTDEVLTGIDEGVLAQVVLPKLPPNMANIYCAMVIGLEAPLRRLEVLECFVYQHGLRHMGEVEHGRALVGLGGMTS
jgi:hypothetical protein